MIHKESKITFSENYNTIVGVNGSGKSAFIEGLQFIINGTKERFKSWKDYISYNEKECEVKVEIIGNDSILTISRRGKRRNNKLISSYFINDKKSNLQKVRNRLFDLGIDLMNPLVTVKQHQISFLVRDFSPNSIFRYIENSSNLVVQKEKMFKINEIMDQNKGRIGELKDKLVLSEWNLKELNNQFEEDRKYLEIATKIEKLQNDLKYFYYLEKKENLESFKNIKEKDQSSINQNNKSISELEVEIKNLEKDVKNLKDQKSKILKEREKFETENSQLNIHISDLNKIFRDNISQIGRKIDLSNLRKSLTDLENELKTQVNKTEEISKEITKYNFSKTDIQKNEILSNELERLKTELNEKRREILYLIKEKNTFHSLMEDNLDYDNAKNYLHSIETTENELINIEYLDEVKDKIDEQFQKTSQTRKNIQTQINQSIRDLENYQERINKIETKGKKSSYPIKLLELIKTLNENKISFIGPICDEISFLSNEIENGFRYLVSNRVWYSLIFFSREDQKIARSLKPKTNEFSIILQTASPNIPDLDIKGIKMNYGRLIDGVKCNNEIKGYLYDIVGNTILTSDFNESNKLSNLKLKTITLEGISVNPSSFYETDIQRKKTDISFNEFQLQKELENLKNSFEELMNQRNALSKEINPIQENYKALKNVSENLDRLIEIGLPYNKLLGLFKEKDDIFEKNNPQIKLYLKLNQELEDLNSKINENKENILIFEKLISIEDEINQKNHDLKESGNTLTKLNSQLIEINDQLSKKNITLIEEEITNLKNINAQINEKIKALIVKIDQSEKECEDLNKEFNFSKEPELEYNEILLNIEILENNRKYLNPPKEDLLSKIEIEKKKILSIKTKIENEENKILKLNSKIINFLDEWKASMTNLIMKVESNSKLILKNTTLEIKLKFQESKENDIQILNNSSIKLTILKNGIVTPATSLSGGESGLIAMSIILALIDEIQSGGVRILDEFDVHLDRMRTIFMRDQILKRCKNSQYLVFTPGKFPELSKGSNIIRLSIVDNQPTVISGWDIPQEV